MREAHGGTWLLGLVITFILIFASYIFLTLTYSKTLKTRNEAIDIIERYEGINDKSLGLINNLLINNRYEETGICSKDNINLGFYGATDLNNPSLEEVQPNKHYYYCIKKFHGTNLTSYYQLQLFYKFTLPVIGDFGKYSVRGTSSNFISVDNPAYQAYIGG